SKPTYLITALSLKINQSVILTFNCPAYNNVSFVLSATNTPSISALLKREKFTCLTETCVPNSFDNLLLTIPTNQF
ncbi:MAG TPA: hypothetical protein PKZ66_05555, partial [Chitinophagaceae bacterium]|nr:hypothetical protein [Chitinophagaceae bacterium]